MGEKNIESVYPLAEFELLLEFTGGEFRLLDFKEIYKNTTGTAFHSVLSDEALFETVKLGKKGAVCWDNGADIDVEFLYYYSELIQVNPAISLLTSNLSPITCNKCGFTEKISGKKFKNILASKEEFQSFDIHFGFGSKYDEERWVFNLCENCLTSFVKSFKYAPKVIQD